MPDFNTLEVLSVSKGAPVAHQGESTMSRREQAVFVLGDIFGGGGASLLSVLYLFFLTDITLLPPAMAGIVVGAAKVCDAVAKPLIGQWSDRTRTRWGRRRPFIALGALAVVGAMALLWWPQTGSDWAKAAWALSTALFYTLAAATVTVTYSSLSSEVTTDAVVRNRINLIRSAVSQLSAAAVTLGASLLVDAHKHQQITTAGLYGAIMGLFAVAFLIPLILVALVCRERASITVDVERGIGPYKKVWSHPDFRTFLWMYVCQGLTIDILASLLFAYTRHVVPITPVSFFGILIGVNLLGFGVCTRLVRTVDKHVIFGRLLPLAIAAGAVVALWPSTAPTWMLYVAVVALAVGMAGATMMVWVMFPDVIDAGELREGQRRAGTAIGLMVLVRSFASAVMIAVVGFVLQQAGYVGGTTPNVVQPGSAVWAIRLVLLLTIVICLSVAWWLARRYRLTRAECAAQQEELARRRSG